MLVALLLVSVDIGFADFYSVSVDSFWSVYRQSSTLNFEYSQSVDGKISPVDFHGRRLEPYHAYYSEVKANDVRMRERTAALEGSYSSEESIKLKSSTRPERLCEGKDGDYCFYCPVCDVPCCYTDPIHIYLRKHAGEDIYNILLFEKWPVVLNESKTLRYQGKGINQREFSGNNMDYAGSNLLYNNELFEDLSVNLSLSRRNITVETTDEALLSAELKPTKELDYRLKAQTTGIADLRYVQARGTYDAKHKTYPEQVKSEERYYGTYYIDRNIQISSRHKGDTCDTTDPELEKWFESWCECITHNSSRESWLPCCDGGWSDMGKYDKEGHSAEEIFNCSCIKPVREIGSSDSNR